jgi:hypothetical protein
MKITPHFTGENPDSPYDGIHFESRKSEIRNPDGSLVFLLENVKVPSTWSQVATDIIAQKYFPQGRGSGKAKKSKGEGGTRMASALGGRYLRPPENGTRGALRPRNGQPAGL